MPSRGNQPARPRKPARTPAARENQLIDAATDLAEEQIRAGTASAQVITHYLKLGTQQHRLEKERLANENELLKAKVSAIESQGRQEEMYEQALQAMRSYGGQPEFDA